VLGDWFPVGPERHVGASILVQPDAEHLMQLDGVALEPESDTGQVQPFANPTSATDSSQFASRFSPQA
jgi:hypothetical protein